MPLSHTLKKRFIYKLGGNFAALALGVIALAVVSRVLGPADFGRFEFLTANFKLVLDTLALQLPIAYFNWISRKGHKENTDYATGLTFYWTIGTASLFAIFIYAAIESGISVWLWPDIQASYLWYALAFTLAVSFYQLCIYLADGRALTVGLEKIRLVQNVLKTAGILLLFGWGILSLSSYFMVQTAVVCFSIIASIAWLASRKALSAMLLKFWSAEEAEKAKFNEFAISYTRPLIITMLVGFVFLYFDRWFLQVIAGSSQQGYYALSERLGMIIFIFTSAMTPLIMREFAFAYEERDMARLSGLFERIKIFIFIAAVAGCFMSVQSAAIVKLFAGDRYSEAIIPVAIMALYPIHQTFGQLSGALLVATGQTRLYANLAMAVMVVSAPVSYILLAAHDFLIPGLALGATGLAIKMVLIQFLGTNVQLYFNTKFLGVSFWHWLLLQIKLIGIVYLLALLAYFVSGHISSAMLLSLNTFDITPSQFDTVFRLALSAMLYLMLIVAILAAAPNLVGIDKRDISGLFGKLRTKGA
jgi:O-antigen/teichoic acid export membrane protein